MPARGNILVSFLGLVLALVLLVTVLFVLIPDLLYQPLKSAEKLPCWYNLQCGGNLLCRRLQSDIPFGFCLNRGNR